MKQSVVVKGNIFRGTKGITVILDPDIPFESLCSDMAEKFRSLSGFLGKNNMAVAFEGRSMTADEERVLLNLITDNSQIGILFLVENNPERETLFGKKLDEAIDAAASDLAGAKLEVYLQEAKAKQNLQAGGHPATGGSNDFYCGTLRSGQLVTAPGNVVIVGDVNPGGTVECGGSIIILGSLKGVAKAGCTGNRNAFVIALEMNPTQIFIAEAFGKLGEKTEKKKGGLLSRRDSREKKEKKNVPQGPLIATYEDGTIAVRQLDRSMISYLEKR